MISEKQKNELNDILKITWSVSNKLFPSKPNKDGIIEYFNRRLIFLPRNVFYIIRLEIEKSFKGYSKKILYDIGFKSGMDIASMFVKSKNLSIKEKINVVLKIGIINSLKISKDDKYSMSYKIGGYGKHAGWLSDFEIVEETENYVLVKIYDSFETFLVSEKQNEPICHFFRGVLAGLTAVIWGREVKECVEEKCKAKGDEYCLFRTMFY
ncbi:MAG: 4-vinyl reductase [Candidatus Aenigmatarchaeota archaeon]